jgi:serine protease Do
VVQGLNEKSLAKVLYLDSILDVAFLAIPNGWEAPELELATLANIETEIPIWIAGIPDGSQQEIVKAELADTIEQTDKITYLELDTPVASDQSGCPVLDNQHRILGLNSAMYSINDTFAFALSSDYIIQSLIHYYKQSKQFENEVIIKCVGCEKLIAETQIVQKICPDCGESLEIEIENYEPEGIARTIENLLSQTGYDIKLARKGPNAWEVHQGSATIEIIYNEKDGYIIGDAILCRLSEHPTEALYEYLLQQNYLLKGLNLSIKGSEIVLSLLIYERDLNMDIGSILFQNLFERADHFDNILVEKYGAKWLFDRL